MDCKPLFEIEITTNERTSVTTEIGTVVMIPFVGEIRSELFNGHIAEGALDRQVIDVNGIKHMSARYMAKGKDAVGNDCSIYIENSGDFHIDSPKPFLTIPHFYTDSMELAKILHHEHFRAEGHREGDVLILKIFLITKKERETL